MVLVAADADHVVTFDVDENAAHRSADAAEASDRLHIRKRTLVIEKRDHVK